MNLDSPVGELPKIGPIFEKKFQKLGISTVSDLFFHAPSRYLDYSKLSHINSIRIGEIVTIHAKIVSITNITSKRGIRMQIGSVEDETGKLTVVWFNQPFLVRMLYPGKLVSLSGKVGFFNKKLCLSAPDYEILEEEEGQTFHTGRLVPIYPETAGLSSKWIRTKIRNAYDILSPISEYLPSEILKNEKLPGIDISIRKVHFPERESDPEEGLERLAFDELLNMHLKTLFRKSEWKNISVSYKLKVPDSSMDQFSEALPFELTGSQKTALQEILEDLKKPTPMNRLLEGDVGSGKTVIAAGAAFAAFLNGCQTVIMAPTQILASQHYDTLTKIMKTFNIRVSLLTSSVKKIELGRTDIFVGTHSLIHTKLKFDKVALVVIDEQHRFGVEQRTHLVKMSGKRKAVPHVLTMTATPIPRTIALTSYGDLDLSILKESPGGRQKVTTWVVPESKRAGAYDWIKKEVKENGSQVFVVCPLIEDSETETLADVKSVTSEFDKLKTVFSGFKLGLLHGRLKPKEKDLVLNKFKDKKIDILVTTPVVEVGIDIPNATVMLIEAAERFGLAQLHQLRGRVGRGVKKSYCLLFSNIKSSQRLKAMEKTYSGFELAELDLKLRGPGEIFGIRQSGFAELKIASWNNFELIKRTRTVAESIIKKPENFPQIIKSLEKYADTR
jgi:ATP-dependent DNA helicase RecG